MEHIAGIDLHSNNGYYGIIEPDGKRVFQKRLPNDLPIVLRTLEPYRQTLRCLIVESTFNWYWLVDGLIQQGYPVKLANPAKFEKYNDLKYSDDKTDAFFLTELERLNILPTGYIYPKKERPIRDLLRRRMFLVKHRTSLILSFQSLTSRETGSSISARQISQLETQDIEELFEEKYIQLAGTSYAETINFITGQIQLLEAAIVKQAKLKPEFEKLKTMPGIGKILALTIMYETGDISRFKTPGNYVSYCRCVKSSHMTNGRKKGEGNRKNGNRYLSWAYAEAAHYARSCCEPAKKFYQRKLSKTNEPVARKALASKLCRAAYFIMRDQAEFDEQRLFG